MKNILLFLSFLATVSCTAQVTHYVDNISPETDTIRFYISYDADSVITINDTTLQEWVGAHGGSGGSVSWGAITGTLSNQTDLQTALDGKWNTTGTTNLIGDVTVNNGTSTKILNSSNWGFYMYNSYLKFGLDGDVGFEVNNTNNTVAINSDSVDFDFEDGNNNGVKFTDGRSLKVGIQYAANYTDLTDLSLVHKSFAQTMIDNATSGFIELSDLTGGVSTITTSNLTASRALVSNGSGKVAISTTTSAEIGFVNGVTSGIQTQLNGKQATITGAATTITGSDLTADRVLISSGTGKVIVSPVISSTELSRLDGVTSAIQTQLDAKQNTIIGAATTITSSDLAADRAIISNGIGKIAVSGTSSTELGYVSGVTSAIQTQLNAKLESVDIGDINATGTPGASNFLRGDGTWSTTSGAVSSVFTRTGAVTAQSGDYTAAQVTNAFDKTADDAADVPYTPTTTGDWPGTDPNDTREALDSLASRITAMTGNVILKADTINLGGWDMDTDVSVTVNFPSGTTRADVLWMSGNVFHDNGSSMTFIPNVAATTDGSSEIGFSNEISSVATSISVFRITGSRFDSVNYNDNTFNRGYVVIFSFQ